MKWHDDLLHAGKIYLLCKGADSVIYNRIQPSESQYVEEKTQKHLDVSCYLL